MNTTTKHLVSYVMAAVFLVSTSAFAATKATTSQGSTPNGKPFVHLQQEVDDLQAQIDVLVGAVDSLEDRVTGLEGAVSTLQTETAALEANLEALAVNVEANEAKMIELANQIVENQNMIALMQDQISHIEAELAKKQNLITAKCVTGTALSEIKPDGSVVCTSSTISGIHKFTVTKYVMVPKGSYTQCSYSYSAYRYGGGCSYSYTVKSPQTRTVTATCPAGAMLISGSADHSGMTLNSQGQSAADAWTASATNYSSEDHYLFASAICVGVK